MIKDAVEQHLGEMALPLPWATQYSQPCWRCGLSALNKQASCHHYSTTLRWHGWKRATPPRHYPPMPENGERDGPVVLRVVELTLTPTSCNTWERRPCTSPGQYNTAKPVIRGMREPTLKLWAWENRPHFPSVLWWYRQRKDDTPHTHQFLRQVKEQVLRSQE